jgi:hypothetical protein
MMMQQHQQCRTHGSILACSWLLSSGFSSVSTFRILTPSPKSAATLSSSFASSTHGPHLVGMPKRSGVKLGLRQALDTIIDASRKCILVGTRSLRCSPRGVEVDDDGNVSAFERDVQFSLCDLLRLQSEAHNTSGNQWCYVSLCDCRKPGNHDRTTTGSD